MDTMVADLKSARNGLRNLDGQRLAEVVRLGLGFFDVIHALGLRSGVLDWVRFRCDLVVHNLKRFRAAVHTAAPDVAFGTDTYPASMALTAGHDYRRWGEMADFASPLVSHISAFVCNRSQHTEFHGDRHVLIHPLSLLQKHDAYTHFNAST